jgi:chromosome segregation ATPase
MPRPTIDEETLDRLKEIVDERAKIPAEHLTADQRLAFALDELGEADQRVSQLSNRVEALESEIEELRREDEQQNTQPGGGLGGGGLGNPNNQY